MLGNKISEILGIAPVVGDSMSDTVKKVKDKVSEESDKIEAEAEETRKNFLAGLKERGAELLGTKVNEEDDFEDEDLNEGADDSIEIEEIIPEDDAKPTPEEIAEFDEAVDQATGIDYDGNINNLEKAENDSQAEESADVPDVSTEEKIEEIKEAQSRFGESILGILSRTKPVIEEEDKMMEELNFYDEIRDMIYDYDRSGIMDVRLEDYLKRTVAKDANFCMTFINEYFAQFIDKNPDLITLFFDNYIEDMIRSNPNWIPRIQDIIEQVADEQMNIRVGWIRALDRNDKVYSTLDEAKSDLSPVLQEFVNEFSTDPESFFDKIWQEVNKDGEEIRRLTEDEVREYIANFRGDRNVLAKLLLIEDKKPEKKEKNSQKTQSKKQPASKGKTSPKKTE